MKLFYAVLASAALIGCGGGDRDDELTLTGAERTERAELCRVSGCGWDVVYDSANSNGVGMMSGDAAGTLRWESAAEPFHDGLPMSPYSAAALPGNQAVVNMFATSSLPATRAVLEFRPGAVGVSYYTPDGRLYSSHTYTNESLRGPLGSFYIRLSRLTCDC